MVQKNRGKGGGRGIPVTRVPQSALKSQSVPSGVPFSQYQVSGRGSHMSPPPGMSPPPPVIKPSQGSRHPHSQHILSPSSVLGRPTPPPPGAPPSLSPPPVVGIPSSLSSSPRYNLSSSSSSNLKTAPLKVKRRGSNKQTAATIKPWLDSSLKPQVWKSLVLHKELVNANKALHPTKEAENRVQEVVNSIKKTVGSVFESREVIKLTMLDKQGLALNGTSVTGIKVGSGWETPDVKVGMRILAVNAIPVQSEEEIRDKLLRSSTRFQLTIEGGDSFERKVHIIGSWSHDTALRTSSIDICIDTPFESDWVSRLAAVLRNGQQFDVLSVCDRIDKNTSSSEPHIVLTSTGFEYANIHIYLSPELARNNASVSVSAMGKPLVRILKRLLQYWGCTISSLVINITVIAYLRSMHLISLGWMNSCDTLGSLFLGYLYWYGLVLDWNTTQINSITKDGQCFAKKDPSSSLRFILLDPLVDVNIIASHVDQTAFAKYLKYVSRTYAVLAQNKRGLDHVLPGI